MKNIFFIMLLLVGCTMKVGVKQETPEKEALQEKHWMSCVRTSYSMSRCENEEAVCYQYHGDGLSCTFKDTSELHI